jgi:hypothetical protein
MVPYTLISLLFTGHMLWNNLWDMKVRAQFLIRSIISVMCSLCRDLELYEPVVLQYAEVIGRGESRDGSVGIALGYGLDDRDARVRFRSGAGNFSLHHRAQNGSGPTQPPIQWVPGALSLGVKQPGREADHSPPSSAGVKERVELYLHSPNMPPQCGAQLKHRGQLYLYLIIYGVSRFWVSCKWVYIRLVRTEIKFAQHLRCNPTIPVFV